jgi:hypothetical protein
VYAGNMNAAILRRRKGPGFSPLYAWSPAARPAHEKKINWESANRLENLTMTGIGPRLRHLSYIILYPVVLLCRQYDKGILLFQPVFCVPLSHFLNE